MAFYPISSLVAMVVPEVVVLSTQSVDPSSTPSSSYLYKSATLKMGDIPTSGGKSIS